MSAWIGCWQWKVREGHLRTSDVCVVGISKVCHLVGHEEQGRGFLCVESECQGANNKNKDLLALGVGSGSESWGEKSVRVQER